MGRPRTLDYEVMDRSLKAGKSWPEYQAGGGEASQQSYSGRRKQLLDRGDIKLASTAQPRVHRPTSRARSITLLPGMPKALAIPTDPQPLPAEGASSFEADMEPLPLPVPGPEPQAPTQAGDGGESSNKKVGEVNWREWATLGIKQQELNEKAGWSQDFAHVEIPDQKEPLLIVPFSDTHIGAWGADLRAFINITDELLTLGPNRVRLLLLGDMAEMAIRLRGVAEVTNQMWPPERQADVFESWLSDVEPLIIAATWDNHAVEREERASGISLFKRMLNRLVVYHDGIGHLDLTVGSETYKIALSHRFAGMSIYNKTHGPQRYMKFEGQDREIAVHGDIHTPAKSSYYDGATKRLAITAGTLHIGSLFGRRHFSLYSIPAFPCFEVFPDRHLFVDYFSLYDWKHARQWHRAIAMSEQDAMLQAEAEAQAA